jgi:hypothetical protein
MKKHWRSGFIIFLGIAIALLIVWFSDAFQQCMNQSYYESSDYEPEKGVAQLIATLGWSKTCGGNFLEEDGAAITAFFTLGLGISTIGLWLSTQNLWRVTDSTLRHAEGTARRELRAYIGVEPRGVKRITGQDLLLGHIVIRNFGRIPAKNISMFAVTDYYSDPTKMVFKFGELYKSKTALQPRAKMVYGAASAVDIDSIKVTDDDEADYVGYIFVYGKVTYTDEVNTDGWTEFCHRYPCEMMDGDSRIRRKHARYHEIAGNAAG